VTPVKLVSIVGSRPQFIKVAPLSRSFERHNNGGAKSVEHIIVHTGQHYDTGMSDVFFDELDIPSAAFNLGVGSGPHGAQTGRMLDRIEQVLLDVRPEMVVNYGDTNSTLAGSLAAAKLHIPVAHIESGLRSFNRRMPEEINRIVADHVSDLLLAPTPTAMTNLEREGLAGKAVWTGDIMYDAVLAYRELAQQECGILNRLSLSAGTYGLVTIHRAENTDDAERLRGLLTGLNDIAEGGRRVVFPVHPRTARLLSEKVQGWSPHPRLDLIDPVGYIDMLRLIAHARMLLTDSGGLQKEAFFLGCPCVTLREETEWVETIHGEGNILAGVTPDAIRAAVLKWEDRILRGKPDFSSEAAAWFGDGHAADKTTHALLAFITR
jgi:UDP-GlcNAc3NAcA epimerase